MESAEQKSNQDILFIFTKELIKHSLSTDITKLQNMIQQTEQKKKDEMIIPFKPKTVLVREASDIPNQLFSQEQKRLQQSFARISPEKPSKTKFRNLKSSYLSIPEIRLPPHLTYLRPIPTSEQKNLDLMKLNPLVKDPSVKLIIGNSEANVVVSGKMGTKPTKIFLTKEDVSRIIKTFSDASKIPISEGVYKVVVGNLIFSAVFSEIAGSRFIIRKMNYPLNSP